LVLATQEACNVTGHITGTLLAAVERKPTRDDVDALVGPATPHFAYQLRARVRELVAALPEEDEVRRYAETQIDRLDRLGHASSKADEGPRESPARLGWGEMPSSAPADRPLPRRA
jgi:hypothetical protein